MDPINGLKPTQRSEEQVLKLPDGNIIIVGEESTSAPELMFKPELAKKNYSGLHELIYQSLMKCEEQYRSRLLGNIVLTGGNSMLPGLDKRIQSELSKMLPNQVSVRVNAQNGRDNFTWKGGVHLCSLTSFQGLWLRNLLSKKKPPQFHLLRLVLFQNYKCTRMSLFYVLQNKKDITIYAFMEWFVPIKQSGAAVVFIIFVW